MYSNEDLERFYFQYQTEALPSGESVQSFCKRKAAEAKARKLDQQLKYAQKNRFGDKRQKAHKDEKKDDAADREDEKDRFDGTDGTVSTRSVQEHPAEGHPTEEKKERDLSKRPEKYDTMSVEGAPVFEPMLSDRQQPCVTDDTKTGYTT